MEYYLDLMQICISQWVKQQMDSFTEFQKLEKPSRITEPNL